MKQGRRSVRKSSTKQRFLASKGLKRTPRGKAVDHKRPLSEGGTDSLRNLRLIKTTSHKRKTSSEARRRTRRK